MYWNLISEASKIDSTDSSMTGIMWDWWGAGRLDPKPLRSIRLKQQIIWLLNSKQLTLSKIYNCELKINGEKHQNIMCTWFSRGSRCWWSFLRLRAGDLWRPGVASGGCRVRPRPLLWPSAPAQRIFEPAWSGKTKKSFQIIVIFLQSSIENYFYKCLI